MTGADGSRLSCQRNQASPAIQEADQRTMPATARAAGMENFRFEISEAALAPGSLLPAPGSGTFVPG